MNSGTLGVGAAVPCNESAHAFGKWGMGRVSEFFSYRGGVCPGAGDVAGLDGDFADHSFLAQRTLECAYQVEYGDGVAVAYVVDAGGGGGYGGLAAVPVGGALGRVVDHAEHGFDDVVDIGEVAFHVAVVVEVDGVAVEDGAGEGEQRHVGAGPRGRRR